jgi:hypothetical protein
MVIIDMRWSFDRDILGIGKRFASTAAAAAATTAGS